MAFHIFFSNWLVCGWLLSLVVGTGVAILQRHITPERFTSLELFFPVLQRVKWDAGWTCYARIRGRMEDQRIQIGRSNPHGFPSTWRGEEGSGWSYA